MPKMLVGEIWRVQAPIDANRIDIVSYLVDSDAQVVTIVMRPSFVAEDGTRTIYPDVSRVLDSETAKAMMREAVREIVLTTLGATGVEAQALAVTAAFIDAHPDDAWQLYYNATKTVLYARA